MPVIIVLGVIILVYILIQTTADPPQIECLEDCEKLGMEYLKWKIEGINHHCYCLDGSESKMIW